MKRAFFENVKVQPYTNGAVISRAGFLSAILNVNVASITGNPTAAKISLAATHCDTAGGDFEAVGDSFVFPEGKTWDIDMGASTPGLSVQVPVDLIGCKPYVKLTATMAFTGGTDPASTNTFALALGDADNEPVS